MIYFCMEDCSQSSNLGAPGPSRRESGEPRQYVPDLAARFFALS